MNQAEIAAKLLDDYKRMLREHGRTMDGSDPVLAAFFRSIASSIERETKHARDVLPRETLERLISALGLPERRSTPAQTVIRFTAPRDWESLEVFTPFVLQSSTGDRLTFRTDAGIKLSEAQVAFVAAYENKSFVPLDCAEYPPQIMDKFLRDPVAVDFGAIPFILIAFDINPELHLDEHGLFFNIQTGSNNFIEALHRELWCLLDETGSSRPELMMRSVPVNGGVRRLQWLVSSGPDSTDLPEELRDWRLDPGFHGMRNFCFPMFPQDRKVACRVPRRFEATLKKLFGTAMTSAFEPQRAWLKIMLPWGVQNIRDQLSHIWINAVSASNVDIFNETIRFSENATSIPVSNEAGMQQHFVRVRSVKNEAGRDYVAADAAVDDFGIGRYRFVRGRMEFIRGRAATSSGLVEDDYVNVSLLVSDGERANNVRPDALISSQKNFRPGVRIEVALKAEGGSDAVPFEQMYEYFADMIRSRERLVTRIDLERFIHSFDPRVQDIRVDPVLHRQPNAGLRRVYRVEIGLRRQDFAEPDIDSDLLSRSVCDALAQRAPIDLGFQVVMGWRS